MTQTSLLSAQSTYECIFGPNIFESSEYDPIIQRANFSSLSSSALTLSYPNLQKVFLEPEENCSPIPTKRKRENVDSSVNSHDDVYDHGGDVNDQGGDVNDHGGRIKGGDEKLQSCKYKPPASLTTECKGKNRGLYFSKLNPNVTVMHVKLSESKTNVKKFGEVQCQQDRRKIMRFKTRGTQSLYRESSAQTLPYLPRVSNDTSELDSLELFKLPTVLPGDGPPGLYEVEVLERARKRWAFTRALKENFRRQLAECNDNATQHEKRQVIEAFEWEHWMEREEHIQECQMLRLEIVIRMFERRDNKMHKASKTRIEMSHIKIAAKREADLRKNEYDYARGMRRLELNRNNNSRNWRKDNIVRLLGSHQSEFYAPQRRNGVNPNRRHFVADRKAFELYMFDLEIKAMNTKQLVCPFTKLNNWSKPKQLSTEIEQNFCSDSNLKKLYDDLKNLRQQSEKRRSLPKCLKEKVQNVNVPEKYSDFYEVEEIEKTEIEMEMETETEQLNIEYRDEKFIKQVEKDKRRTQQLIHESRQGELEAMLLQYEGSTLGWLMKFLCDELSRLKEQRNLQFITMLAQKERWRREAAEAGLRQKENEMRKIYENIYQQTNEANGDICSEYLANILDVDVKEYAEEKAENNIIELAKLIDSDIQRWLDSLNEVQNPLNYKMLRYLLRDIIFPNVNMLINRYECELIVDGIINDVLFPHVYKLLEPYDVSFTIASDMIDRLIDNDLYFFSDDSSVSSSEDITLQEREARAILRKLIRQAVPGRRWMTKSERFGNVCVGDLLDTIFDKLNIEEECPQNFKLTKQASNLDLVYGEKKDSVEYSDSVSDLPTTFIKSVDYEPFGIIDDFNPINAVHSAMSTGSLTISMSSGELQHEMMQTQTPMDDSGTDLPFLGVKEFIQEDLILKAEPKKIETKKDDVTHFLRILIQDVIKSFIPHEDGSHDIEFHLDENENEKEQELYFEDENIRFISKKIEEESTVDPENSLKDILRKVFETIAPSEYSAWEESDDVHDNEMEAEGIEEEFKIFVNESEIEMLRTLRCKCQSEKEREQYIREMLQRGRVEVIRKPRLPGMEEEKSLSSFSIRTFEYDDFSVIEQKNKFSQQIDDAKSMSSFVSTHTIIKFTTTSEGLAAIIKIETVIPEEHVEEREEEPYAEEVRSDVLFSETVTVLETYEEKTIHTTIMAEEAEAWVETVEAPIEPIVEEYIYEAETIQIVSEHSAEPFSEPNVESSVNAEPIVKENIFEAETLKIVAEATAEPTPEHSTESESPVIQEPIVEEYIFEAETIVVEPESPVIEEPIVEAETLVAEPTAEPEPEAAQELETEANPAEREDT